MSQELLTTIVDILFGKPIYRLNVYRGSPRHEYYFSHYQENNKRIKANQGQGFCFCGGSEKSRFELLVRLRNTIAPFNNMRTLKFKAQPTNTRRLLPASANCRARCKQLVEHNSDIGSMLGSSRKLRGATERFILYLKTHLSVELLIFGVRMLLKVAVNCFFYKFLIFPSC